MSVTDLEVNSELAPIARVIVNEAQLPKPVHEQVDSQTSCANISARGSFAHWKISYQGTTPWRIPGSPPVAPGCDLRVASAYGNARERLAGDHSKCRKVEVRTSSCTRPLSPGRCFSNVPGELLPMSLVVQVSDGRIAASIPSTLHLRPESSYATFQTTRI